MQACKKETSDGLTAITYYATLNLLGDEIVSVDKGSTYEDAGVYAEMQGEDITDQVKTTSDVNTAEIGLYHINYSVVNAEGFTVTASRIVCVNDPTSTPIKSGGYTVKAGTNRLTIATAVTTPYSGYPLVIYQVEPGVFYISDFLGGYYDVRAGYGSTYAMVGHFKLNSNNTITMIDSSIAGWGDSLDGVTKGKFDPATGRISFTASYAGSYDFNVIIE
ncbi:protein of unknown function [bacterium A37T11]|nr:protein of unknown function [bacterium A37T11]